MIVSASFNCRRLMLIGPFARIHLVILIYKANNAEGSLELSALALRALSR